MIFFTRKKDDMDVQNSKVVLVCRELRPGI